MENDKEYLYKCFKELRVKHFVDVVDDGLKDQDPKQQRQTVNLLKRCCEKEKSERKSSQIASKIKSAKFGHVQTVENYDFNYNPATRRIEKLYLSIHNNVDKDNLPKAIFVGNTGLGKTHLARSLGYAVGGDVKNGPFSRHRLQFRNSTIESSIRFSRIGESFDTILERLAAKASELN